LSFDEDSTSCVCNGKMQIGGRGGPDCQSFDGNGGPFCFVDSGVCPDGVYARQDDKYWSNLACVPPPLVVGGQAGFDRANVQPDTPFVPEVYFDGNFYPVCGLGFADDNEGAAAICRAFRFGHGGFVKKTNAIFIKDAMPVGKCNAGESLDSCTGGENAHGDLDGQNGQCKAGNPVGVEVTCYAAAAGSVKAASGEEIIGDARFTPEVYLDGSFHPLCFADDDTSIAAAACLTAGFPDGGYMVKNRDGVYDRDALPVTTTPHLERIFWGLQSHYFFNSRSESAISERLWTAALKAAVRPVMT
jgi:hypothetical protein